MENQYAQALLAMVQNGMQPKRAVDALAELLKRQGRGALLSRIGKAFARLAEREARRTRLTLTVAREKDEHAARREAKKLLDEMNAEASDVAVRVDDSLIGGWRLEGREQLIDSSFKKHLLSIYNRSTQ